MQVIIISKAVHLLYNFVFIVHIQNKIKIRSETNGLDDFFGFGVEETQLHQEIKDLKAIIEENQDIIDSKDVLINELKTENANLKQTINSLESQLQHNKKQKKRKDSNSSFGSSSTATIPPHENDDDMNHYSIVNSNVKTAKIIPSILRPSPQSQTTAGSALFSKTRNNNNGGGTPLPLNTNGNDLKHSISPSLNNFLDKLDFKFKEDEENGVPTGVDAVTAIKRSPALLSSNSDNLNYSNDEKDNDDYISTASILMDIDGHLPQLRRSSLSEEEQERMEHEAILMSSNDNLHSNTTKNKDQNNDNINENRDKSNSFNNVIFKDSNVKNMNMNIINHHQHNHSKSSRVDNLKKEIQDLKEELENMRNSKIQLIINTNDEINKLRTIIRQHLK